MDLPEGWSPFLFTHSTFLGGIGQRDICYISRVCKHWHRNSTSLLYFCPFLVTNQQVNRFCRTVTHSSDLAKFVHYIFVAPVWKIGLDSLLSADITFLGAWATTKVQNMGYRRYRPRRMVEAKPSSKDGLLSALHACSSLEHLISTRDFTANCLNRLPDIRSLPRRTSGQPEGLGSKLRSLSLAGPGRKCISPSKIPYGLPSDLHLPYLEGLTLVGFVFYNDYELPIFPALHTLQLSGCMGYPRKWKTFRLSIKQFPALRTVHLCTNYFSSCLDSALSSQIEHIYYHGYPNMTGTFSGPSPSLRSSMIEIPNYHPGFIEDFSRLFCGPHTCIIDMRSRASNYQQLSEFISVIVPRTSFSLKRLAFLQQKHNRVAAGYNFQDSFEAFLRLKELCEGYGVQVSAIPISQHEAMWETIAKVYRYSKGDDGVISPDPDTVFPQ